MSTSSLLFTKDDAFVDEFGRRLLLRGVNLSGASKAPLGQPSQQLDDFWEDAESGMLNFSGRPLNLDDGSADEHLERLRGWGYNMIRYPVTWEALEHEGPGTYDEEFIEYTICVLQRCRDFGFKVFMDPHQDIWSRFSGGSGAPYWTLIACGMNPRNFTKTRSALIHSEYSDPEEYPAMIWSTNYTRLASQTLFALFFGGKRYSPKCIIDGMNIQDYLQSHYIEAFGHLADRIRQHAPDLLDECIIGWDTMNEPSEGFIGWMDLEAYPVVYTNSLWKGTRPTPAQSLRLGVGQKQEVEIWDFGSFGPKKLGKEMVDPEGMSIWADASFLSEDSNGYNTKYKWTRDSGWKAGTCVWALHGVWDPSTGDILKPMYFALKKPEPDIETNLEHREGEFTSAYWHPHVVAYMKRIYQAHPNAIVFLQPPVFVPPPEGVDCEKEFKGRVCYSPHYYDGLTLITRHWSLYNADALGLLRGKYRSKFAAVKIGESAIRKSFREQLGMYKDDVRRTLGPYPTLIGEIGIPYDMDKRRAYGYTDGGKYKGDYSSQTRALDASLFGADGADAINYTVWNYCPDNSHRWGDQWNREDLSIWSPDDVPSIASGGHSRRKLLKRSCSGTGTPATGRNVYPPTSAANSRAALMGSTYPSSVNVLNAPSTLSLDTLDVPNPRSASASQLELSASMSTSISREKIPHPNAYAFLSSGARAVKAFCRPWPISTVGRVTSLDFDLQKAEMKMTLSASSSSFVTDVGAKGGEVMTEIYVPLVQFASDEFIRESFGAGSKRKSRSRASTRAGGDDEDDGNGDAGHLYTDPDTGAGAAPRPSISHTITSEPTTLPAPSVISKSNSTSSGSSRSGATTPSPVSTLVPSLQAGTPGSKSRGGKAIGSYTVSSEDYALEVKLTTGRFEIHGQYLHWFYSLPPSSSPVEYSITLHRSGGPITPSLLKELARSSARAINGSVRANPTPPGEGCFGGLCEWVAGLRRGCTIM